MLSGSDSFPSYSHRKSRWYFKGYGKRALLRSNGTSIKWAEKIAFFFSFLLIIIIHEGMRYRPYSLIYRSSNKIVSNFYVVLGNEPGNWIFCVCQWKFNLYQHLIEIILGFNSQTFFFKILMQSESFNLIRTYSESWINFYRSNGFTYRKLPQILTCMWN